MRSKSQLIMNLEIISIQRKQVIEETILNGEKTWAEDSSKTVTYRTNNDLEALRTSTVKLLLNLGKWPKETF